MEREFIEAESRRITVSGAPSHCHSLNHRPNLGKTPFPAGRWIFNNAPVTQCFGPGKISRPYLQLIRPTDHNLRLTTQENDDIKPLSADGHLKKASNCILGIYLSPDGDFTTQLQIPKKKADAFDNTLWSPCHLTLQGTIMFHRTTYGPSMQYALPALSVDKEELSKVQSKFSRPYSTPWDRQSLNGNLTWTHRNRRTRSHWPLHRSWHTSAQVHAQRNIFQKWSRITNDNEPEI